MSVDTSPSSVPGVRANPLFPKVPSSRPEMKARYAMLGLVAVCVLALRLMASFLGLESSQKDLDKKARTRRPVTA